MKFGDQDWQKRILNVKDLSSAIYFVLKKKIKHDFINIGGGEHYSIKAIAQMIKNKNTMEKYF